MYTQIMKEVLLTIDFEMGFFINDLHCDIEKLHAEEFNGRHAGNNFNVYHG